SGRPGRGVCPPGVLTHHAVDENDHVGVQVGENAPIAPETLRECTCLDDYLRAPAAAERLGVFVRGEPQYHRLDPGRIRPNDQVLEVLLGPPPPPGMDRKHDSGNYWWHGVIE